MTLEECLHIQLFLHWEYEEVGTKQFCGSFLPGILEYWGTSLSFTPFSFPSVLVAVQGAQPHPKTLLSHFCLCGSYRLPSSQDSASVPDALSPGLGADGLQGRWTPSLAPSWSTRAVNLLVGEVKRTQMLRGYPTASANFLLSARSFSAQGSEAAAQ